MPLVVLACLAYVSMALPDSVLGIVWPSMSADFHQPVGTLGLLLVFGIAAAVLSSTMTGRILTHMHVGQLLSGSTVLSALALIGYGLAPSFWAVVAATVLLGLASGALDSGLNAYAASRFGPRHITWLHASYGLGAALGPATVTIALSSGVHWRWAYAVIAVAQTILACAFLRTAHRWTARPDQPVTTADRPRSAARTDSDSRHAGSRGHVVVLSSTVFALHIGIESGTGLWGYVFLTAGRGLPPGTAGLAVSGFWATMFIGRVILGPVAERVGASRVLSCAVAGIVGGAAMMALPGPALFSLLGMLILGLAAAPVFPLLTLTTAERVGPDHADRTIGFQVAASKIGAAALPAGMGLLIQHVGVTAFGLALLVLVLIMATGYSLLVRSTSSADQASAPQP
ncbi:MFS transporter [Streptomyces sp. 110]|uniref:MFS transporter n=1 Tax=Streptomyces endocoffeicus TaxID=2898945 RepID=A0ABS1Q7E5_9ACTN|nr:MFS transporter [Streptomyces endocoffeicus]MBL1120597.1 MFS transporter [Streptomyces endocoffeicus]